MNRYGKHAQESWKMLAPNQYAMIEDPQAWFTRLGQDAETSVGELTGQIAGPDPKGETYLEKVGRLNVAKAQAEEIVRAEMLTPQSEDLADEEGETDEVDSTAVLLEFRKDTNRIIREGIKELNRVEMERGLKSR